MKDFDGGSVYLKLEEIRLLVRMLRSYLDQGVQLNDAHHDMIDANDVLTVCRLIDAKLDPVMKEIEKIA